MSTEDRVPVLVAGGHAVEREGGISPLDLAVAASEAALSKAPGLRSRIDRVSMVNILSGGGSSPATVLSLRLGLSPKTTEVSTIGGNSPQWLVNRAAAAIAAGDTDTVLISGAEAQRSRRLERSRGNSAGNAPTHFVPKAEARRGDATSDDAAFDELPPDPLVGDDRPGAGAAELAAGLIAPIHLYALFESVLAHRAGHSYAEHRTALGELMAPFTEVAAKHPYAWFQQVLTPTEISVVTEDNRLVSEPYTKRMCAIMQVDQGAAVVMTSLAAARRAGVDDQAIFCLSGAESSDVWFPVARPDPGTSPAIAAAASAAFKAAGIGIDDVGAIDLYSCFPSVVEMATEALGLDLHDPRGFTVTGGLPYFGGPGNDYTLHAIVTMADHLREHGGLGLVTGLGWYATKHSVGVYGVDKPAGGWRAGTTDDDQRRIDASAVGVVEPEELQTWLESHGSFTAQVVACTVGMDHQGRASSAPVIARLEDGRQVAVAAGEDALSSLEGRNLVGERIVISGSPPRYLPEH
jgi:acetyl-CoA C-acetyltransferase